MIHCKCCGYKAKTCIEYCEYTGHVKEELQTRTFTHVQATPKKHPRIGWDDVVQWEVRCWDDMWVKEYAVPGEVRLESRGSGSQSRSRSRSRGRSRRTAAESHDPAIAVEESEGSQSPSQRDPEELRRELRQLATKLFAVCQNINNLLSAIMDTLNEWNGLAR